MVQELQHQSVPEEFFNLTQLAEVTLIAGKLSTTDINEIRNYINKTEEDCPSENVVMMTTSGKSHILSHHNVGGYESTKKKWKNHWENFKDQEIHSQYNENVRVQAHESSPSSSVKTYAFLSSSCSSVSSDCDDDSTKSLLSYSHKVFDRKKQRSFKQSSTESEYEFHFESQRPPYGVSVGEGGNSIALHFNNENKDTPRCDSRYSDEPLKIDIAENDMRNGEIKTDNLSANDGNFEMRNDDHICVECGKKYSTSKSIFFFFVFHDKFLNNFIFFLRFQLGTSSSDSSLTSRQKGTPMSNL